MTHTIKANDSVSSIISAVNNELPKACSDSDRVYDCYTIIDVFHANMREHVAPKDPDFQWWLTVSFHQPTIRLRFEYGGPCFDPTQVPRVEQQAIEFRPIGGLGLTLITQLSDKIDYTYQSGLNTLTVEVNIIENSKEEDTCL